MYAPQEIILARNLRKKGKTYSEIQTSLGKAIPKSTLSFWFKSINLTDTERAALERSVKIKLATSQEIALKVLKQKREIYLKNLKDKNKHLLEHLNNSTNKLILAVLYLGEGAKHRSTRSLTLASSDPNIIKLYLFLLNSCFYLDRAKFRVKIQCRADQNVVLIKRFWMKITNINGKQFYPTYIDKRTVGKKTLRKNYMGVCSIMYFDTSIQLELEYLANSMIEYILKGP